MSLISAGSISLDSTFKPREITTTRETAANFLVCAYIFPPNSPALFKISNLSRRVFISYHQHTVLITSRILLRKVSLYTPARTQSSCTVSLVIYRFCQSCEIMMNTSLVNGIRHARAIYSRKIQWSCLH